MVGNMNNYKAKKKFGQNFLKDKSVLINIIDSVSVNKDDLIIEIGPGKGALTKYLKLFNANLLCYEVDTDLSIYLKLFEDNKTRIIYNDFLNSNIVEDIKRISYKRLFIIANLPYYITTPIIEKIINSKLEIEECVFMVQDEVAYRLCAKPGNKNYGAISVILDYYFDRERLFKVPRESFEPVPNVDSAIIKLKRKKNKQEVKDFVFFKRLIYDSFAMKRKNLKNNLKKYDLNVINEVLKDYKLSINDRAEDVPLECFIKITNLLS